MIEIPDVRGVKAVPGAADDRFPVARDAPRDTGLVMEHIRNLVEGYKFVDNFHVLVDFAEFGLGGETDPHRGARTGSFFKKMNFGVEMPIGRLTLRTGFHQGYVTAGLGINLRYFKLDFATYGEELGDAPGRLESRRFALTLAIGGGSDNPAPVTSTREVPVSTKDVEEPKAPEKVDPSLQITNESKPTN